MKDRAGWAIVVGFSVFLSSAWITNHYVNKPAEDVFETVPGRGYENFLKPGTHIGVFCGDMARTGILVASGDDKLVMLDDSTGVVMIYNESKITAVVVIPRKSETLETVK